MNGGYTCEIEAFDDCGKSLGVVVTLIPEIGQGTASILSPRKATVASYKIRHIASGMTIKDSIINPPVIVGKDGYIHFNGLRIVINDFCNQGNY